MKLALAIIQKKQSDPWVDTAASIYKKKISNIAAFEELTVKSKNFEREDARQKQDFEGKALLKIISPSDLFFIFDERGKEFKNSVQFSEFLVKQMGSGKSRLVFAIGGPYGFSDEVRERADQSLRLSNLTFNHHLARIVALEQIYRGLSIWKNLPYHNE
jgi:23S rRNA (pseudouridine1915-N3)-methyltransferase